MIDIYLKTIKLLENKHKKGLVKSNIFYVTKVKQKSNTNSVDIISNKIVRQVMDNIILIIENELNNESLKLISYTESFDKVSIIKDFIHNEMCCKCKDKLLMLI